MSCPRPRARRFGGVYMPKNYMIWKKQAKKAILAIVGDDLIGDAKNIYPIDKPIELHCKFVFKRPNCYRRQKDPFLEFPHTKRKDLDNLVKSLCDVLQDSNLIRDDCLIHKIVASKLYSNKKDTDPYIEFEIKYKQN